MHPLVIEYRSLPPSSDHLPDTGPNDRKCKILRELDDCANHPDDSSLLLEILRDLREFDLARVEAIQEYSVICKTLGIHTADPQETLARILHRLGCALYYGDNPRLRDTRVLVPDWVVNGVYALIRGVQRRGDQKPGRGMLPASAIAAVLCSGFLGMAGADINEYPENTHEFLLNLMIDRELCFESTGVTTDRAVYLFPELLPDDEPEDVDIASLCAVASTRFRYRYDFLPDGVMSRFIVRTLGRIRET